MDFIEAQQQILTEIKGWQEEGLQLVASSSFQTQSLPLLHILSKLEDSIPILFIDTGYHFPETYSYLQQLQEILQLNIKEVSSEISKSRQRDQGNMLYVTQPDFCCHINKVVPLQQELAPYDLWISGVRKDQTQFRKGLEKVERLNSGQLKYHPMLSWTSKDVHTYIEKFNLPRHPLEAKGYLSIGCMPCTRNVMEDMQREGRWYGRKNKECGIHLQK